MSMGATFSAWRNLVTHICFVCTFMSDGILPDCPSAAISRTAAKLSNYTLRSISWIFSADVEGDWRRSFGEPMRVVLQLQD
jgi:hypothetical protein